MVGTTIGKYRIVERLGRGGMGTVYKAVDETLDREVAVKVLNSDVDDSTLMARFRAEAKTVARLNHPQIATIYEIYRSDTDLLMVMELVRGETLDRLSARVGPLPIEQAATLIVQILGALGHAHRSGIVHRDLKPANLMITESGTVKVMDFGIARVLGAEHLTMDGMLMGTPAYMAPEQVMGQDVDARTDLYSVGVVFYRLLTGCLPFQADTPIAIVRKQLADPPTPAHSHRPDLPEWCETILSRALAKDPAERFQSADEFRSAIVSAIGHSNVSMGVFGSEYLPRMIATPTAARMTVPPTAPTAMTPTELVDLSQAPTLVGEPTPIPMTHDRRGNPARPEVDDPDVTRLAPVVQTTIPPAPVVESTASPRGSYALAAIAAIVIVAGGLGFVLLRGGTTDTGGSSSSAAEAVQTAAASPAPGLSAADASVPATTPVPETATAGASGPPDAPPAEPAGTTRPAAGPAVTPASRPAAPAPLASSSLEADAHTAAPAISAAAAALPPLVFSAQTVVVEGGRNRQRDSTVQIGNGRVTVTGKDNAVISTVPFDEVVGVTYSNTKQPMWNSPQGPAEIAHLDGGAFGFLRGDQHWVSLRTSAMSLVLRVRDQDSRRVVAGIEERTGRKVEVVAEK